MDRITWLRQSPGRSFYINRYDADGVFSYPEHDHEDHWEFVYVLRGSFKHTIHGERRVHEEGRLVLIRDADFHSLSGSGFKYVNLAFHPAWMERYGAFSGRAALRGELEGRERPPEALVADSERPVIATRFDGLLRAAGEPDGGIGAFASFFPMLVSFVEGPSDLSALAPGANAAGGTLPPAAGTGPPDWLFGLVAWARARERPPSPAEFVRKSGYSAEHVIRTMRRHYGTTPSRFLAELRLRRAEDLLRFTNYPIERVAEETGWNGLRHFERCFSARSGSSPRAYRAANAIFAH